MRAAAAFRDRAFFTARVLAARTAAVGFAVPARLHGTVALGHAAQLHAFVHHALLHVERDAQTAGDCTILRLGGIQMVGLALSFHIDDPRLVMLSIYTRCAICYCCMWWRSFRFLEEIVDGSRQSNGNPCLFGSLVCFVVVRQLPLRRI